MRKWTKKAIMATTIFSMATGLGAFATPAATGQAAGVAINEKNFPNAGVLAFAKSADSNGDGILSSSETKTEYVYLYDSYSVNDVSSITKYFKNIKYLSVNVGKYKSLTVGNTKIKSIFVRANNPITLKKAAPTTFSFSYTGKKTSVNFSKQKGYQSVKHFYFSGNGKQKKVVLANASKLKTFGISNTAMTKFNASALKKATALDISNNTKLKSLNVSKNKKLTSLSCYNNKLTSLNLSANKALKDVGAGNNKLKKLNLSANKKINSVVAYSNKLKGITLPKKAKIKRINLNNNKVTSYTVPSPKTMKELCLSGNKIKKLKVTKCTSLEKLEVSNTKLASLNLTKNKKLSTLRVANTKIKNINLKKNTSLNIFDVGSDLGFLKNTKLKFKTHYKGGTPIADVYVNLQKGKTYDIPSLFPFVKGYSFYTLYNTDINCENTGKITMLTKNKWTQFYATDGKRNVYFHVNYN